MDSKSITIYLIVFWMGLLIGSIGKETVKWVVKMLSQYIQQKFLELGIWKGDFPIDMWVIFESSQKPIDSEVSIRLQSRDDKPIDKCRILLNKKKLCWWRGEGKYTRIIQSHQAGIVRIPKKDYTKEELQYAEGEVRNNNILLKRFKFKELAIMDD